MLPLRLVLLLIEALEFDRFMRGRMPDSISSLWSPAQRMREDCFSGGWLPDILAAVGVGVLLGGEEGEGDEDGNN